MSDYSCTYTDYERERGWFCRLGKWGPRTSDEDRRRICLACPSREPMRGSFAGPWSEIFPETSDS